MTDGAVLVSIPQPGAGLAIFHSEESAKPSLNLNPSPHTTKDPKKAVSANLTLKQIKSDLSSFTATGLMRVFLQPSLVLSVDKGKLLIDPWQNVFLIDYETAGKRREFRVQVLGGAAPTKEENGNTRNPVI